MECGRECYPKSDTLALIDERDSVRRIGHALEDLGPMTTRVDETSVAAEGSRDHATLTDRERAEEMLIIFGRLGRAVHDAITDRVGSDLAGNPDVFVICSLHLRGPLRPSDIVDGIGMTSGGVTKLIDRLEQNGYIRREFGAVASDRPT